MNSGGMSKERLGRLHNAMAGYVERGEISGIVALVSRGGEAFVDTVGTMELGGGAPMKRDMIFRVSSLTKPVSAAAAMILVEEGKLRLDDPVDRLLPEVADRRVLKSIEGPLDDTVPARRPITLRDLLDFRLGIGVVMAMPGRYPIQAAIDESGIAPGPTPSTLAPDEWIKRLGRLPLVCQPGEQWMYHIGSDVLGILIARAAGQTLGRFMRERIFEPLGMKDTGFHVPVHKLDRLPFSYYPPTGNGSPAVFDDPANSLWGRPPIFESGGGGLVSTADDLLAFCRMLLGKGQYGGERILSRMSVELMMTDHLTAEQKRGPHVFLDSGTGWGFGGAVNIRRDNLFAVPGRYGWEGGTGTSAYTDPREGLIGILLTQRLMASPAPPPVNIDFWNMAYQAIDD